MKLIIIGMGFLARYLLPCYECLMGKELSSNVLGIKGSQRDMEKIQAECAFPVQVRGADAALKRMNPDIIILSVKPDQIDGVVKETLMPYYEYQRKNKNPLPDLYSFAPDPPVQYYYDKLGDDVNAVNMLPNMIGRIEGIDVSQTGVSFLAFDKRRVWPEENRIRAMQFMKPTSHIVEIDSDKAVPFLALQCASHLMIEVCCLTCDILQEEKEQPTLSDVAKTYRKIHHRIFNDACVGVLPATTEIKNENVRKFMDILICSWNRGLLKFGSLEEIQESIVARNVAGSMETYLMEAQLESREELMIKTKNHATPGGFLEMALKTYYKYGDEYIKSAMKKSVSLPPDANVCDEIEKIAFIIAKAVSEHGKTVSGIK